MGIRTIMIGSGEVLEPRSNFLEDIVLAYFNDHIKEEYFTLTDVLCLLPGIMNFWLTGAENEKIGNPYYDSLRDPKCKEFYDLGYKDAIRNLKDNVIHP